MSDEARTPNDGELVAVYTAAARYAGSRNLSVDTYELRKRLSTGTIDPAIRGLGEAVLYEIEVYVDACDEEYNGFDLSSTDPSPQHKAWTSALSRALADTSDTLIVGNEVIGDT